MLSGTVTRDSSCSLSIISYVRVSNTHIIEVPLLPIIRAASVNRNATNNIPREKPEEWLRKTGDCTPHETFQISNVARSLTIS